MVSGRWPYASGSYAASHAIMGFLAPEEDGGAGHALAVLHPGEWTIERSWFPIGMRATGSDTVVAEDVFVPDHRVQYFDDLVKGDYATELRDREPRANAAFLPTGTVIFGGIQIGLGRAALEHSLERMKAKGVVGTAYTQTRNSPVHQVAVAQAMSKVDAAELLAHRACRDIDVAALRGSTPRNSPAPASVTTSATSSRSSRRPWTRCSRRRGPAASWRPARWPGSSRTSAWPAAMCTPPPASRPTSTASCCSAPTARCPSMCEPDRSDSMTATLSHRETTAVTPERFRHVLGHYPTGVTVVTARTPQGDPVGMTIGSFTSISLDPALVGFFPARTSGTFPAIRDFGSFCVNVVAEQHHELCARFAGPAGRRFQSSPGGRPSGARSSTTPSPGSTATSSRSPTPATTTSWWAGCGR